MRHLLRLLGPVAGLVLLVPGIALAHAGHQPLPEGFESGVVGVVDVAGQPVELPGVTWQPAENGMGMTLTTTDVRVVQVAGEQAGEPFLRVAAGGAAVNIRSPQAADVTGAEDVDPADAAELVDILQGKVEPEWMALASGGEVHWIDHRPIGHSHAPDRAAFTSGERTEEWELGFSLDGVPYRLVGEVVAVGPDPLGVGTIVLVVGTVLATGVGAAWWLLRRLRGPAASPGSSRERVDSLTGSG